MTCMNNAADSDSVNLGSNPSPPAKLANAISSRFTAFSAHRSDLMPRYYAHDGAPPDLEDGAKVARQ